MQRYLVFAALCIWAFIKIIKLFTFKIEDCC